MNDIEKLADFLDTKYRLPMGFRIGWDGILGLIPGVGDLFTSLMSFYIIARAAALGCSPSVLLHMGFNVLIDNLIALIPILGNIGDFFWKANTKNLALLNRHIRDERGTRRSSLIFVIVMLIVLLVISVGVIALGVWALIELVQYLF